MTDQEKIKELEEHLEQMILRSMEMWHTEEPPRDSSGKVSEVLLVSRLITPPPDIFKGKSFVRAEIDIYHHENTAGFTGWQGDYMEGEEWQSRTLGWMALPIPPLSEKDLIDLAIDTRTLA